MHITYLLQIQRFMRTKVLQSTQAVVFWNKFLSQSLPHLVRIEQVYTNQKATTIKASTTAAYPVYMVLLNFSKAFRRYIIDQNYSLVGLLPVSFSEFSSSQEEIDLEMEKLLVSSSVASLMDSLAVTYSTDSRNVSLHILQISMHKIFQTLSFSSHRGFPKYVSKRLCRYHPVIAFYCCDIPNGKNMFPVKHDYSCIRCLTWKDDIAELHEGATQDPHRIKCTCN